MKDSYKSQTSNNNTHKNVISKASDGKETKPRKNSALPEPVILKKVKLIFINTKIITL